MTSSQEIAQRVAYWRRRRGMTMRHFADRVGRSVSWAEKIESGDRELVRLPMLERVADALQISVSALIGRDEADEAQRRPDEAEISAIKSALGSYGTLIDDRPDPPLNLESLRQRVDYANAAFLSSDFAALGQVLPELITEAAQALRPTNDRLGEAAALAVMIYKIASSALQKFGSHDIAWLAADRAMYAAARAGDPVSLARATRCAARALMSTGQRKESIELVRGVFQRLQPEVASASASPELLSLIGMMLLAAEIAAAREGDSETCQSMHESAEALASRLGDGYHHPQTAFGVSNVKVHRLSALVRLGNGPAAIDYVRRITESDLNRLPRERKANYLLDLAEAHRQCGQPVKAVDALVRADMTSPQEVRRRPIARELITALLAEEETSQSPSLRRVATHAGLTT